VPFWLPSSKQQPNVLAKMCLVSPTLTSAHTPSDQEKPWPVPEFTIMPIGRWSSDAFLQYICRQVLQFSAGVSKCMISTQSQDFFTLPEFDPEHPHTQAHQTNFQYSPQQNAFHSRPCIRIPPPMVAHHSQNPAHHLNNNIMARFLASVLGPSDSRNENSHTQTLPTHH
jgi:hypothetical protein